MLSQQQRSSTRKVHRGGCLLVWQIFKRRLYVKCTRSMRAWVENKREAWWWLHKGDRQIEPDQNQNSPTGRYQPSPGFVSLRTSLVQLNDQLEQGDYQRGDLLLNWKAKVRHVQADPTAYRVEAQGVRNDAPKSRAAPSPKDQLASARRQMQAARQQSPPPKSTTAATPTQSAVPASSGRPPSPAPRQPQPSPAHGNPPADRPRSPAPATQSNKPTPQEPRSAGNELELTTKQKELEVIKVEIKELQKAAKHQQDPKAYRRGQTALKGVIAKRDRTLAEIEELNSHINS